MSKENILKKIIAALQADLDLFTRAARGAHAAATHAECLPDNKYDTTALEASYVAQGQANRAQEIRRAFESYRSLQLRPFAADDLIRLTALVTIVAEDGRARRFFLGPDAGGLKLTEKGEEWIVITPESSLGRALLGKNAGDEVVIGQGAAAKCFFIVTVA